MIRVEDQLLLPFEAATLLREGLIVTMLSDRDIRLAMDPAPTSSEPGYEDRLRIVPHPSDEQFQPCTVDLRLGNEFIYTVGFRDAETGQNLLERRQRKINTEFRLKQGQFILATTLEFVSIPDWMCAKVDGKSSLGRKGIMVHVTAGLIDPGFQGTITLEIKNVSGENHILTPGQMICQLEFHRLSSPALRPYGHPDLKSKYQFQRGVVESR